MSGAADSYTIDRSIDRLRYTSPIGEGNFSLSRSVLCQLSRAFFPKFGKKKRGTRHVTTVTSAHVHRAERCRPSVASSKFELRSAAAFATFVFLVACSASGLAKTQPRCFSACWQLSRR